MAMLNNQMVYTYVIILNSPGRSIEPPNGPKTNQPFFLTSHPGTASSGRALRTLPGPRGGP